MENVLSIDKIKHLQELGVNTGNASMTWMLYPYEEGKQPQLSLREWRTFKEPFRKEHCIPAFTLLDIFELLPKEIKTGTDTYWITMYFSDKKTAENFGIDYMDVSEFVNVYGKEV